jgi:hypothetical protein
MLPPLKELDIGTDKILILCESTSASEAKRISPMFSFAAPPVSFYIKEKGNCQSNLFLESAQFWLGIRAKMDFTIHFFYDTKKRRVPHEILNWGSVPKQFGKRRFNEKQEAKGQNGGEDKDGVGGIGNGAFLSAGPGSRCFRLSARSFRSNPEIADSPSHHFI